MTQKGILHQILIGGIAIMVIAYMVLQLTLSVGDLVTAETVELASYEDTLDVTGYILRNEKIISSTTQGTISYLADDNEKVYAGMNVVMVYSDSNDALIQKQIIECKRKIDILKKSSSTAVSTTNIINIENSIHQSLTDSIRKINNNNFTGALYSEDELLILMNRKNALKSQGENYELQISALNNEVSRLENSIKGNKTTFYADKSGYFYSNVDGYESIFTISALNQLSVDSYYNLIASDPSLISINAAIGKIVYDSKWYFLCTVDKRTASTLTTGGIYDFSYIYSNNTAIKMKLEKFVSQTDNENVVAVFSSQEMPNDFSFKREQPVKIQLKKYEGLEVPTTALRKKDGKNGVYIIQGNVVQFREVEILFEQKDYFIVALPDSNNKAYLSETKLSLYDLMIIGGKNIYDGKVLK
ncbi:MAG: hypothetical protein A2Y17_07885 [Clostridiales bacterium GWF2_38_85]|nr:MAG: hypothetical protein A2Y17_07885 [Clostridiales bacterium GWF2_38_85]HBL84204.1 hypothetical protein [Clostridiales bacterium]